MTEKRMNDTLRKFNLEKLLYNLNQKVTVEDLIECYNTKEGKVWGVVYRDCDSEYDMRVILEVFFTKHTFERVPEINENYLYALTDKLLWVMNSIADDHDIDLQEYYMKYETERKQ